MMRPIVGVLAIWLCATACASESGRDTAGVGPTAVTSRQDPGPTAAGISSAWVRATASTSLPPGECSPGPSVELRGKAGAVTADLVFFEESSATCQLNADGAAMFDSSFRPQSVLVTNDGGVDVVVDEPGEVRLSIRELGREDGVGVSDIGGQPLVGLDGRYPLALPGPGCFLVTIGFEGDTRRGQFIALVASSADEC